MFPVIMTLKCNFDSLFIILDGWDGLGCCRVVATRSYFIFSSPWSQINCSIDLRGRAAMVLWLTTVLGTPARAHRELMSTSTAAGSGTLM